MQPRLCILLPTHNRADTLEWALRSIARQTESNFEVLICGDGCTDGTANLAREWAEKDPRFLWFDLPKMPGFGYANRNQLMRHAKGEFMGYMAHDDLVFDDHFSKMLEPFADPNIQLVASRPLWVDNAGVILPMANNLESSAVLQCLIEGHHYLPSACYMHRRSAFIDVGWWNENLPNAADLDYWRRIALHYGATSVRYLTTPGVLHFRAQWKTNAHPDPHQLTGWADLLTKPGGIPDDLRSNIRADELPQAHIGERLMDDQGNAWQARIRHAADLALDSYAFTLTQFSRKSQNQLKRLTASNAKLEIKKTQLKTGIAALQAKLAKIARKNDDLVKKTSPSLRTRWFQWFSAKK